ncbi:MAG: ArsI/CadI family heavy metal resistance metalloenzyme [Acinetobacter sp.]
MKRFHVHIAVDDIKTSIHFYSQLFGQQPTKQQEDYAKWMLDDPRVNFAISAKGHVVGLNHLGFQVDSVEELIALEKLAKNASDNVLSQKETTCCYAKSEKHWTIDPQGLAWEHFYTVSDSVVFGDDKTHQTGTCCIPLHHGEQDEFKNKAACCIPNKSVTMDGMCCG